MTTRFASRLARRVAIIAAIVTPCAGFAACGLDENGIVPPDGAPLDVFNPPGDGGPDTGADIAIDNYIPPACSSLDASCLGAAIPDGWVPVGLVENLTTPCGDAEDFEQTDWVANVKLHNGACSCGVCTTTGSWACGGQITVGSGNNGCNSLTDTFSAGPHCTTSVSSTGSNQISGTLPTVGGTVNCSSSLNGSQSADTTNARTCKPLQCTTNFCGLANQGFKLCVLYNGAASCPAGFTPGLASGSDQIDLQQNTKVTCNLCQCSVNNLAGTNCTAALRTFSSGNCDGDGSTNGPTFMNSYPAQGTTCIPVNNSAMRSIFYQPDSPPDASCNTTTPSGNGTATFKAPLTVCCK